MKASFLVLPLILLVAAGCTSNEPEGFMPTDSLDLEGKPRASAQPEAKAAKPGDTASPSSSEGAAKPRPTTPAEAKATLGYAPDASGNQKN